MANQPTVGVFLPSFLNTCNSTSPTGQGDAYSNVYPSGLTAGKLIELGTAEAQNLAAPGTTLYDGAYMWVKLDSGATATNATNGLAAYLLEASYDTPTVTTSDKADSVNLFAGVFINPATVSSQDNKPTPGNWIFIFAGGGRATVQVTTANSTSVGGAVNAGGATGHFTTEATSSITTVAKAVTAPSASSPCVAYFKDIFYRLPS